MRLEEIQELPGSMEMGEDAVPCGLRPASWKDLVDLAAPVHQRVLGLDGTEKKF